MRMAPKPARVFVGAVCGLVLLSALGMIAASTLLVKDPVWVLFGFEIVIALGCVMGLLFAAGRFQDGQGLAMACVAGTIAVGSFLGWLGAAHHQIGTTRGDFSLNRLLLARAAAAVVLGVVGALLVLSRNPRSWSYVWKAALTGGPILLIGAVFALKRSAVTGALSSMPGWMVGMIGTVGGILAVVLISASVHCLVRAFELGRTE
jgi:hypothetical protein